MSRPRIASGFDWLGSIPSEWDLIPLGRVFRERRTTVSDADFEPLSVSMAGIVPRMENVALTASGDNRKLVRAGDYVINSRSDRKGSGGLSPMDGSVSVISTVLRPTGIEPRYAHHLLRSSGFQEEFYRWGSGIVADLWSTRYDKMSKITLPLPPLAEQARIADFLDRETAKTDALIEKQNTLVERLGERRTATIARILTTGLQDGAELRESGIPFIEDIPKHWDTVPTRYLCRVTTGAEDSGNADPDGEYPFFVRGREVLRSERYGFDGEAVMTPGDGQGGTGKVFHYFNGKFEAHQRVYVFHNFSKILGKYFFYWLSSFLKPIALASSNTVTMESLRRPVLVDFRVAVPPLSEQSEALEHLDRETAKIDTSIAKAERFVELARERRAALITAAVTGQIDVEGVT